VVPVALSALKDQTVGSTVAANGDTHPYSVAVVPPGYTGAPLAPGDVLVGDLSNTTGVKGQGTSIVRFHLGTASPFSTAVQGPVGLAFSEDGSALWTAGFGSADNGTKGAVTVLQTRTGSVTTGATPAAGAVGTVAGDPYPGGVIGDPHGPWGITTNHSPSTPVVFWANADGTIVRDSKLTSPYGTSSATANVQDTIATLGHGPSPSIAGGTVVAPQGLAYDPATDTLYVADSADNEVVALKGATTATAAITPAVVLKGGALKTPRGLALDPVSGNLLVTNALDNKLVAVTPAGGLAATRNLDPSGTAGAIAGLATTKDASGQTQIYYVNDNSNTLHSLSVSADAVTIDGQSSMKAAYGSDVSITGRAPAGSTVGIFFHRAYVAGYVQRRTLQADANGVYQTSFAPNDDYRYYAQVGTKQSATVLVQATPAVVGPTTKRAARGHTVLLVGHGAPHTSVLLHFHKAGTAATNYNLLRSVQVDAHGVWTKPVVLSVDYRVYASRGTFHPYTVKYLLQGR
jgi:sugar lactone lactonase YvrE